MSKSYSFILSIRSYILSYNIGNDSSSLYAGTITNAFGGGQGDNSNTPYVCGNVVVDVNGGTTTINMGQGDTDGVDSNGGIYINGGTLNINAQSPFDYDGEAKYNGGTMIINGEETTTITNQFMGGPGGNPGGHGGRRR